MAAVATLIQALILRQPSSEAGGRLDYLRSGLAGAAVLGSSCMGTALAGGRLHPSDLVLALALSPAVIALLLALRGTDDLTAALWPGLAGLTGLLLLLPMPSFQNVLHALGLALVPALMGSGIVFTSAVPCRNRRGTLLRTAVQLFTAAIVLGTTALLQGARGARLLPSILATVWDGLLAWLTITAITRMGAMRFCSLFFVVPLVTSLEGLLLLRPALDLRSCCALALLMWAVIHLLRYEEHDVHRTRLFA